MNLFKKFLIRLDFLAFICGILIAVQARVNGELSLQLKNPLQAAFVSFSSGLIVLIVISIFSKKIKEGLRKLVQSYNQGHLRFWNFIGGAIGGNLIAIQTLILPKIGVAIFSVGSIAGQTCISLLVDKVGITGGGKKEITLRRVLAALITIFAIVVSVIDRIEVKTLSISLVALAILSGTFIGVQRALNGKINEHSEQNFSTTLINFIGGVSILGLYLFLFIGFGFIELNSLKLHPLWMYSGGVIGIVYIAFAATIVQHLGVLVFTLYSVGGQLMGSLIIDYFLPVEGIQVTFYLVLGIAMTYIGVIVGGVNNSQSRKRLTQ